VTWVSTKDDITNCLFSIITDSRLRIVLESLATNEELHTVGILFTLKRDKELWTSSKAEILLHLNKNTDQIP